MVEKRTIWTDLEDLLAQAVETIQKYAYSNACEDFQETIDLADTIQGFQLPETENAELRAEVEREHDAAATNWDYAQQLEADVERLREALEPDCLNIFFSNLGVEEVRIWKATDGRSLWSAAEFALLVSQRIKAELDDAHAASEDIGGEG